MVNNGISLAAKRKKTTLEGTQPKVKIKLVGETSAVNVALNKKVYVQNGKVMEKGDRQAKVINKLK